MKQQIKHFKNRFLKAGFKHFVFAGVFLILFMSSRHWVGKRFEVKLRAKPFTHSWNTQRPLENIRICLDPGHGGEGKLPEKYYTGGSKGVATGQTEGAVNLRVALYLKDYFVKSGADVFLTRSEDVRCQESPDKNDELRCRSDLVKKQQCHFFLSLHHNFSADSSQNKFSQNFTQTFFPDGDSESLILAENIASSVSKTILTHNAGAVASNLGVLKGLKVPGVLIELSHLSHPAEDARLVRNDYNQKEARAVFIGFLNYVRVVTRKEVDFATLIPKTFLEDDFQSLADTVFTKSVVESSWRGFNIACVQSHYNHKNEFIGQTDLTNQSRLRATKSFELADLFFCE